MLSRSCTDGGVRALAAVTALLWLGCNGEGALFLSSGDSGGHAPVHTPGTGEPSTTTPSSECVPGREGGLPETRLWRLSHAQYDNAVQQLLGADSSPGAGFEREASGSGFSNGADTAYVSQVLAEQYQLAAERLAAEATSKLESLLPCSPADAADEACVAAFIAGFGKRAFRQPLTDEQQARYLDLYRARVATSPEAAVGLVIQAMLQSPYFLYRMELGPPAAAGEIVALTPHEMATQLSFWLWNSPPDDTLLALADDGSLTDPQVLRGQLDRLLADPRARPLTWRFLQEYLHFNAIVSTHKDPALYPEFTDVLASDLTNEAETFINSVMTEGSGTLTELLTADYSFVNARLATHYGVPDITGEALQRVTFPSGQRSGLLTHAGLLAVQGDDKSGSPVKRGLMVRSTLLCHDIPPPPQDVVDTLEPPGEVKTTRQRYEAHLTNASCMGCHQNIDPIGFAFEHYDAIGRYRTTENGVAVDATGEIFNTVDINGKIDGALSLTQRLATSSELTACVSKNFYRFALGRLETDEDACTLEGLNADFIASGTSLNRLARSLAETPSFSRRIHR